MSEQNELVIRSLTISEEEHPREVLAETATAVEWKGYVTDTAYMIDDPSSHLLLLTYCTHPIHC